MWLHILLCVIKKNPVQETLNKLNLEASMRKILLHFLIYSSLLNWDLLAALILSKLNGDAKRGCMCETTCTFEAEGLGYSHMAT
jgi:hypothetical protein